MVQTAGFKTYSDVWYTDRDVAKRVIDHFRPTLPCLEPFAGDGAFLDQLPAGSDWCEITRGRDFANWNTPVRWIITNPPFSDLTRWMAKAFDVAANVVFVIPLSKLFSSAPRMALVKGYGGVKEVLYLGPGRGIGFPIGFPFGAVHFAKGYTGPTRWEWGEEA